MRKLAFIFVITFALYFVVSNWSSSFSNFDSQSYSSIGVLTLNGKSVYPDPAISRHPYLPFFLYFESATLIISSFFKIPQLLIIKITLTIFHLLSIHALYILSKKNFRNTLLYAMNPISLLIIAFHGQFDIIPITLILFAILALQNKQFVKTILLLSLAITVKTWPILFILPFLKRIKPKYYISICLLPLFSVLLYSILFSTSVVSILRVLVVYQGASGIWGFGSIFSFFSAHRFIMLGYKVIFVAGLLIYSYRQKKSGIIEELFDLLLLFFLFTPGFGIQWFLWLIPYFFLSKKLHSSLLYSALFIGISVSYFSWIERFSLSPQLSISIFTVLYPIFLLFVVINRLLPKKNLV